MGTEAHTWTLRGGRAFTPAPFGIMGIVNLTPDSFYDGGTHDAPADALAHARLLLAQGAHILDLGAESSRPGAEPVTPGEELRRLLPVLGALRHHAPAALLSVDTYHAATAAAALAAGAHIINDISACTFDPALLDVVVAERPGYVLMHSQGVPRTMQQAPRYTHVVDEVVAFFEEHMARLSRAGLPETHIVLDPGIGFGKRLEHNMELLRHVDRIQAMGRPVLMGISMKSVFRDLLDLPPEPALRANATQACTALLAARGIALHRVHDVAATAETLRLALAMQP